MCTRSTCRCYVDSAVGLSDLADVAYLSPITSKDFKEVNNAVIHYWVSLSVTWTDLLTVKKKMKLDLNLVVKV